MATSAHSPPSTRNRLLSALPPEVLEDLWPRLEPVELTLNHTLHAVAEPITAVFFPETGWVSMVAPMEDGDVAEVGIIGREGMVGLPIVLGGDSDDIEGLVQQRGTALRMESNALRAATEKHPAFRTLLLRYALLHQGQVARTAACNIRHQIEQRLARWLLMSHDRAEANGFEMTHEFLSMMLGVRRAGVSVAAGALQKAGLIRYGAGRVEVTDRPGLEGASCECYAVIQRSAERLFGVALAARAPQAA